MYEKEIDDKCKIALLKTGEFLKQARLVNGYSQKMVYDEIGIHRNTLTNIEKKGKNFTLLTLIKLSELYDIELNDVFFEDTN